MAAVGLSSGFVFGFEVLGLRSPRTVASASYFSGLEATGFGFGFQIIILEVLGLGFGFLNFQMEATGFGFGLGFLSPSWPRLRLRSHQPGFQPNPARDSSTVPGNHTIQLVTQATS